MEKKTRTIGILLLVLLALLITFFGLKKWNTSKSEAEEKKKENAVVHIFETDSLESIPVMFGASILKVIKFGFHYTAIEVVILLVGCLVAFFVSVFAIKFLMGYIKKHDFKAFGYYRIVLGVLVLLYFLIFG